MLKKSLLMSVGSTLLVLGMILFPLPVPLGLPTMVIGLMILLKASHKVKRIVLRLADMNPHTRKAWQIFRRYQRRAKL